MRTSLLSAPTADTTDVADLAMLVAAPSPGSVKKAARAHRHIARALLAALALQLFFAGLGVFGITTFFPHVVLGTAIVLASVALPIVAWRARLATAVQQQSWLLVGLMLFQGLLIDLGRVAPVISAFHPVNAMLLVLVTYGLARRKV